MARTTPTDAFHVGISKGECGGRLAWLGVGTYNCSRGLGCDQLGGDSGVQLAA